MPNAGGITENDFAATMDLIQTTIDPDSWERNGGKGRIMPYPQMLSIIVTQSAENHDRIQNLLVRLRELYITSISVNGKLLVMSPEVLAAHSLELAEDSTTLLGEEQAESLVALGKEKVGVKSYDLPSLSTLNGQMMQYQPPYEAGVREYGGVDFSNIRMRGGKWVSQDIVHFSVFGERIESTGIPNGNQIAEFKAISTQNVPDDGFIAIDVSENLIDKESNERAFLVLQVGVHSWK